MVIGEYVKLKARYGKDSEEWEAIDKILENRFAVVSLGTAFPIANVKAWMNGYWGVLSGGKALVNRPVGVNVKEVGKVRYVYDARVKRYRDLKTGCFVSKANLPYPSENLGFSYYKSGKLQEGMIIDRYGSLSGRYAAEVGATISGRGMPIGAEALPYVKLKVVKPIPVEYGPAAPVPEFGAKGGAIQYYFNKPIQYYIDNGYLSIIYQK